MKKGKNSVSADGGTSMKILGNDGNYHLITKSQYYSYLRIGKIQKNSDGEEVLDLWEDDSPKKTSKPTRQLLNKIKRIISKYLDTSNENVTILSLWILGTYFQQKFIAFPILQIYAQKGSGKTRTLKLTSSLCWGSDGSVSTSITETHLFRHKNGSILFDEQESINSKEKSTLRELLNTCYKKGNKIVRYRETKINGKKSYESEEFYPYYPIGLANINGLNDVLGDRAIQIILRKSNGEKSMLIEDFETNPEIISLKQELCELNAEIPEDLFFQWNNFVRGISFNQNLEAFFNSIKNTKIVGRELELFFPLFYIAHLTDSLDEATSIAVQYVEKRKEEAAAEDYDEMLKKFLILKQYSGFTPISLILNEFRLNIDNPENWINSKWLGRAIKRLDFVGSKRLVNGATQIMIKLGINNNSTNAINTTNTTNSTNSTKKVELVDSVELIECKEKTNISTISKDLEEVFNG